MDNDHDTDIVTRLRESGRRITRERELLLRIIGENAHLDAEAIYRLAQKERPQIGLATVYRTLNMLQELGIVRSLDFGENHGHYELHAEDHVHLVCSRCGRVTDIPVPNALHAAARNECFTPHHTNLEVFGVCKSCADVANGNSSSP
jgi:Fur family transcriptional regulator, ferric uptake regulator